MSSEAVVQQQVRLAFPRITGGLVFRNNVGACTDDTGRVIRYGLGNDSAQLNRVIKSSDLICVTPVRAWLASANAWVTLGVFTALEIKPSGYVVKPTDDRAIAQAKFHAIVRDSGGFAGFVSNEKDIFSIIRQS